LLQVFAIRNAEYWSKKPTSPIAAEIKRVVAADKARSIGVIEFGSSSFSEMEDLK
jgi:hypothetical protein